jgi:phage terminase large subunit
LDYGFAHNTAFYLFTRHDNVVYVVGEHVQNKWLVPNHVEAMNALLARLGIPKRRLTKVVAGHDVFAQRGDSMAKTIADQYRDAENSFVLQPAKIDRITGASELLARLGNTELGIQPTLKVFTTCVRLIETIPLMVHDPNRPEDVLKVDADNGQGGDDPYDACRYGLMEVPVQWRKAVPVTRSHSFLSFG